MSIYIHRYLTESDYIVVELFDNGGERTIPKDQHDYLSWIEQGNTPIITAAGRFMSVVNGQIVVDPNKDAILAAEAIEENNKTARQNLYDIDMKTIRALREWAASREDATEWLKQRDVEAKAERAKLKEAE